MCYNFKYRQPFTTHEDWLPALMHAVHCLSAIWQAFALAQVLLCWGWKPLHQTSVLEPTVNLAW